VTQLLRISRSYLHLKMLTITFGTPSKSGTRHLHAPNPHNLESEPPSPRSCMPQRYDFWKRARAPGPPNLSKDRNTVTAEKKMDGCSIC